MPPKLLSKAHVQWAQTLLWGQVPVNCNPDGLCASMYGHVNGNWQYVFLLSTSGLLDKLQAFMPDLPGTVVFSLYGD